MGKAMNTELSQGERIASATRGPSTSSTLSALIDEAVAAERKARALAGLSS